MKKILVLFIFLMEVLVCQAQDIYFDHLDLKNGLSQISVTALEQDSLGTMWIGTRDGLNRYNGYEIDVFRHNRQDTSSLLGNNIRDLKTDANNKLWILTAEGISNINLQNEELINFPNQNISCFHISNKNIWVGTNLGLFFLDEESRRYKAATEIFPHRVKVNEIFEDSEGNLLIGTSDRGLFLYNAHSNQLDSILDAEVSCIHKSMDGLFWLGTTENGVYCLQKDEVVAHYSQDSGLAHNVIRDITEDNNGRIWIGTFLGLSMLDPEKKIFTNYFQSDKKPYGLSHNSIYTLFCDQEGSIWIGSYFGGVNIYNSQTNIFRYFVAETDQNKSINYRVVGSMIEDDDKNLWIATEGGGVNFYDRKNNKFKYITKGEGDYKLSHNNAKSLYLDKQNQLWIGTHLGGLDVLNTKTGRIRKYIKNEDDVHSIPSNIISAIIPFENNLLLGTNDGVVLFNPNKEEFTPFFENSELRKKIGKKILALLLDKNQCLWIGSETKGLSVYDFKSGELKNFRNNVHDLKSIGSNFVYQIYQDHMRRIWVATSGGGLNRYHPENDSFSSYTSSDYDLSSDFIYGIAESRYGFLWIATSKGISRFDVEEETFRAYDYQNGFPLSEINERGLYITSDGEVFVGGIHGMVSFYEKELQNQSIKHPLYFTELRVNNSEVHPNDESGILSQTLPFTKSIRLNSNHSVVSFDFTSFNYLKTNKTMYSYKLEGFDSDWVDAGYRRSVNYTNLKSGTYIFTVKEKLRQGEDGAETSMKIIIDPPYYNTWWAYLIYISIVSGILLYINRVLISKALLEDNLKKEQRDKEQISEMNRSKLQFFTNISHEFRTPLTLILGQLESLLEESSNIAPKVYNKMLVAYKNSYRLKKLIDELLEFRKQELGHMKLKVNEHDFVDFSNMIFDSFKEYAERRHINYKLVCYQDKIPLWFDARQLEKVFFNLLSNAFKFTPDGGSIYVLINQENKELIIKVIDSGQGMPKVYLEKIFDRFYQVDNISEHKQQQLGSGIGLALTKGIVDMHGGCIRVESELGEGACFEVSLLLGKDHFEEEQVVWDKQQVLESSLQTPLLIDKIDESEKEAIYDLLPKSASLLIVEDNAEVRDMLCASFMDEYHIIEVEDGQMGLEAAQQYQPDLIISDVMMPVMTGTDMCQKLKSDLTTCHIPIILLTAKEAIEYRLEGLEIGADDYITKPFNIKLLQARCRNLIKSRKQLQERFQLNPGLGIKSITTNSLDAELLEKAIDIVERHLDNSKFDVNTFAQEMCLGRTNLYAKIKGITGQTPNEFILSSRLKKAALLLQTEIGVSVSNVAYSVGFTTPRYFSKCFSDHFKISPSKYAKGER
ncbi:response regulator [Ancylomarina euxinus]|uniref:histidine kinase n=1 Tax=Ancylomarina euxinus TaxID=2283627 RepID=A0A425XZ61_9BACT|nr:two-component regulator propeller domain-containing protein [Ancylomarina euxinus]MCZ4694771.1 ATP-binding protein [Ancylomarina euxinus]MUP15845.1 response regulator [Ancylomarina euxinus]RRG20485.1 response regulator [Ancylomarina euxinus]